MRAPALHSGVQAQEEGSFTFSFEAVPGPNPDDPPVLLPFGPPSLTALVTMKEAYVEIHLLQQGLPPGSKVYFSKATPVQWHDYDGTPAARPDWIAEFQASAVEISFIVNNPAGTTDPSGLTSPIIVGFTPVVLYDVGNADGPIPLNVPDPSIVNVDPTGGSN